MRLLLAMLMVISLLIGGTATAYAVSLAPGTSGLAQNMINHAYMPSSGHH